MQVGNAFVYEVKRNCKLKLKFKRNCDIKLSHYLSLSQYLSPSSFGFSVFFNLHLSPKNEVAVETEIC
jgi:hypothetical protein